MSIKALAEPISDKQLAAVKKSLSRGAVGINSALAAAIIARLELGEATDGSPGTHCANCTLSSERCQCEVFTATTPPERGSCKSWPECGCPEQDAYQCQRKGRIYE